ncbi:MAG: methionyl-tRNA formyltransferase [Alphaproteobacteria bacterium]|nr:methionyl-tRNA formyltransferase [Alphaproteobacteria bacterium]
MRLIFMGTPDFSVPALNALHDAGHDICAVYTRPPAKKGRGMSEKLSPVHECAEALGLDVFTPKNFKSSETVATFASHQADLAVVVAYGLILPESVLSAPEKGCWNIHASLLPRWRGAAPIQRAIMSGDKQTGICIMQMEAGLDTGAVLLRREIDIDHTDTASNLHDRLMELGGDTIVEAINEYENLQPIQQSEAGVTYAQKIDKQESRINWLEKANQLDCFIRGLSPFPGAWFDAEGDRIKVLAARPVETLPDVKHKAGEVLDAGNGAPIIACGIGALELVRLQRAGKSAMTGEEFQRGKGLKPGMLLL